MIIPKFLKALLISCLISSSSCLKDHCQIVRKFERNESCAVVKRKYRIEWNRNQPILKTDNTCRKVDNFFVTGDSSGLFEYVQVGDSLYKAANSFKVYVYRKGEKEPKVFNMDFGCR
jgi:hypothetical protein